MDKGLFEAYGEVIEETWGGLAMNRPPLKGGTQAPQDSRNTLSSASSKIGIEQGSLYNQSQASGNNPYEQEESKSIDKQRIYDIIEHLMKDLDSSKITDRTAVMILGKLKNILNKT